VPKADIALCNCDVRLPAKAFWKIQRHPGCRQMVVRNDAELIH
jgi:hypothetical protein